MDWRAHFPVFIHVVAYSLDQLGNEMSANRLMSTTLNLNACRPVITGEYAYAGQSFAMKSQN
jgi:hypothetical protein